VVVTCRSKALSDERDRRAHPSEVERDLEITLTAEVSLPFLVFIEKCVGSSELAVNDSFSFDDVLFSLPPPVLVTDVDLVRVLTDVSLLVPTVSILRNELDLATTFLILEEDFDDPVVVPVQESDLAATSFFLLEDDFEDRVTASASVPADVGDSPGLE
jgi:hypothetical protein